jgi:hypothetical protein
VKIVVNGGMGLIESDVPTHSKNQDGFRIDFECDVARTGPIQADESFFQFS